jgi:hypothetical protein
MRLAYMSYRAFLLLAVVLALALSSSRGRAQSWPKTEELAADTAELVAEANVQRVLTAPLQGCLLDMQVCATLDATLHRNLKNCSRLALRLRNGTVAIFAAKPVRTPLEVFNFPSAHRPRQ